MTLRVAVIPARLGSTRLPEKPLADIGGKTLIERVWENAKRMKNIDRIMISTDSERIRDKALEFGAECVVTGSELASGSDRVYRTCSLEFPDADIVVNIQGDEPFIDPALVDSLVEEALCGDAGLYSAYFPITGEQAVEESSVKVVFNNKGEALYFSRSPIPHNADIFYKHLGVYVWKIKLLEQFHGWEPTMLEKTEKLEQLRVLEMGHSIRLLESPSDSLGIDTPADLEKARSMISDEN
jgi:3-deoxy-D-manno-octulosonate cytidylyltransferase